MLEKWPRVACIAAACGCYSPAPVEGLACSETGHCPAGQECDAAFGVCVSFPLCLVSAAIDTFDQPQGVCAPWGNAFGNADVDVTGGALAITPVSDIPNTGGCKSSMISFDDGGVFVEVVEPMPAGHGATYFIVIGGIDPTLWVENDVLTLGTSVRTFATMPHDPVAMRWWRLRPDRLAETTVGEYSADGSHWKRLGAVDVPPEPMIRIEISAGVSTVDPDPRTTRFDNLNVCPPRP